MRRRLDFPYLCGCCLSQDDDFDDVDDAGCEGIEARMALPRVVVRLPLTMIVEDGEEFEIHLEVMMMMMMIAAVMVESKSVCDDLWSYEPLYLKIKKNHKN